MLHTHAECFCCAHCNFTPSLASPSPRPPSARTTHCISLVYQLKARCTTVSFSRVRTCAGYTARTYISYSTVWIAHMCTVSVLLKHQVLSRYFGNACRLLLSCTQHLKSTVASPFSPTLPRAQHIALRLLISSRGPAAKLFSRVRTCTGRIFGCAHSIQNKYSETLLPLPRPRARHHNNGDIQPGDVTHHRLYANCCFR